MSKLTSRQSSFHKIAILFGLSKNFNVDSCLKSIDFEDKFSHDNRSVQKTRYLGMSYCHSWISIIS